jgi:hypothetical protein
MSARRLVRALYACASGSTGLRKPLDAIRSHPRVRAFARSHVEVLLGRGTTWANLDGALRLLAEDPHQRVVFGPWQGDAAAELLYWAPFLRWAQQHFSLDPARVAVVSRGGVGHWYGGACGTYFDAGAEVEGAFPGAAVFRPGPVLALVDEYRSGTAAPRPLFKRSRHVRLPPPADTAAGGLPDAYVAVALQPSPAFPASEANREATESLIRTLSATGPVVPLDQVCGLHAQHALLARATGLIAVWSGLAVLGALSGVPTIALRSADGQVSEPDLDLATRVSGLLGTSLTVLDTGDLASLATALGGVGG